jgi:hypothetical protein
LSSPHPCFLRGASNSQKSGTLLNGIIYGITIWNVCHKQTCNDITILKNIVFLFFQLHFRSSEVLTTHFNKRFYYYTIKQKPSCDYLQQWSSTWSTRRHLTSIKTKHRNRFNLEPALILTFTKIRPRIEVLVCQKQAQ